jgi:hypothetical protein
VRRAAHLIVAGAVVGLGGCNETINLLDVAVQVRLAAGHDVEHDEVNLNITYVTDTGDTNGVDAGAAVKFPEDAGAMTLTVRALRDDGALIGLGRTGAISLPALSASDPGRAVAADVLVASVDAVDVLDPLPPAVGDNACVTADEAGRVFLVGGAVSSQSGYLLGDGFAVDDLDDVDSFAGVSSPGCSARGGSVVVVGGCPLGSDPPPELYDIDGDGTRAVSLGAIDPELCQAFAASSGDDYWVVAPDVVALIDGDGAVIGRNDGAALDDVVDVEATADGDVVVLERDTRVTLLRRDDVTRPVTLTSAQLLGRRFDDVVALDGPRLSLLKDGALGVIRSDVDVGAGVVAFTVLSDDTVVAIVGDELQVSRPGAERETFSLPTRRLHVSALAGDTVVLAGGGDGVDAIVLSVQEPQAF